jgi:hypothetical protein
MGKRDTKKRQNFNLILGITTLLLFLFFFCSKIHNWANSILIKLHFCDHTLCIIYSLIWFIFFVYSLLIFLREKKENKEENFEDKERKKSYKTKKKIKKSILCLVLILIVGIILMNIIKCYDSGKIGFEFENYFEKEENESLIPCEKSTWPNCLGYCDYGKCTAIEKEEFGLCWCEKEEFNISVTDTTNFTNLSNGEINESIIRNCEEIAFDRGFPNWESEVLIINHCEEISEEDCGKKPGDIFYDTETSCCLWDCDEPQPPIIPPQEEFCQDSDEGLNPQIAGTCYDEEYYQDTCLTETILLEYYCSDNNCVEIEWQCDFKCTETEEGGFCS